MTWTIRLVNVASASMAMARKEARKSIFAHPHQWGSEARGGGCGGEVRPRGRPPVPPPLGHVHPGSLVPRGPQPRPGRHAPLPARHEASAAAFPSPLPGLSALPLQLQEAAF